MFTHFKRMAWKASLSTTLISLLVFTIALAASGDLDAAFDGDGLVTTDFGVGVRSDVAYGIAIQANGKIVAAGSSFETSTSNYDFALARYNPNGSLDTTFSGDGKLITNFGSNDEAWDVAVQSDGKIIAAGRTCNSSGLACNVALARYNTNGTLDTTFSGDGKQITDFDGGDNGSLGGLAIQSDGKIVLAGYVWNGMNNDFAVYRYNTNGTLDSSLTGDGMLRFGFGLGREDRATDLDIQRTDGKIVVAGYSSGGANGYDFAIARLNPGGGFDTTFSGDGRQITNFGGEDFAYGFAGQPDGKMVVIGQKINFAYTMSTFAIARYNPNGSLDDTFGQLLPTGKRNGKKVFSVVPGAWSYAYDAVVQPGGKILVMGANEAGSGLFDFALVRLNPGGGFDTSFSGDGKVTIDFGNNEHGRALVRQPSGGKYLLAGFIDDGTLGSDFALARVLP